MLLITAGITILAGILVAQLRTDAVAPGKPISSCSTSAFSSMTPTAWPGRSSPRDFPTSPFAAGQHRPSRIEADLAALRGLGVDRYLGLREVAAGMPAFEHDLVAQRLIAARRVSDAGTEVLVGVDGANQLIRHTVQQLGLRFSQQAARANRRLYQGALFALAVTGLLVALLMAVFAAGRPRAFAAERAALERGERRFRALVPTALEFVLVTGTDRRIT
ncbi:MAG: hypothetical protein M3022_11890, partial [Actinomycetota bacterium]|nr:hypothetical protein [Actinomycetota bacterium]